MSLTVLAWLAVGAYALHILEERILGWFDWAKKTMNLSMDWNTYTAIEVVFLIVGAIAAMLAPALPVLALAFAALLVINVTFFHLLPMVISGGTFSPGAISGVLLFYPVGYYAYAGSGLPQSMVLWSVAIGAAVILWPVVLLKLKDQPYFRASGNSAAALPTRRLAKRRK
ncbi:MAG: HXXEE domain-containing protein [Bradyrhizobiaceae bacterium]|nr:HXXEE domain-containing protein [Bradyrhizobiaceae bacterium]